jgi:hypothetical protein
MSQEDHKNYVCQIYHFPLPLPEKFTTPAVSATHGSKFPAFQVTKLCPSSFKLYNPLFG